ncbi:hypothetical protein C3Y94_026200 [Rhizobium ruizarguesonis]|uniref:hypothetical protein n=1 Tax=Rhizobium ruizarguesonis TaxID=2081791 RepID=UPI001639597D|nr:hypothetical protein [Rhizobium ruizarguesonis]MBC2806648.1 hypothetical protein [Rhizobium ruizarguesonis]
MSNRLILGAFDNTFVLRISRPGANVLDPALPVEQLAFDSRWASLAVIHQQGLLRGQMARVDMVGPVWSARFTVSASYPNLPLVIVSARPEWTDLDWSPTYVGNAFGAAYNPSTRIVELTASAPWWTQNTNTMSWGWFRYFLMRVQ